MAGVLCLQGGAEFGPACQEMDADLLRRAGGGPVVVSALAGAPGRDYETATANGVRHFSSLGAVDVVAAPDARTDPDGALTAIRRARLLVLPGGSPRRLLEALATTGVDAAVAELHSEGAYVMGASAGAMVLCEHTVLPEGGRPTLAAGLGLVRAALVRPHWTGRDGWAELAPPGTVVLGLPECSGLLVDGEAVTAVGARPSVVRSDGATRTLSPGETATLR